MGEAAAQNPGHRLLNLSFGGFRVLIQKGLRRHDDSADAEPALGRLLIDKSLLNRVRILRSAKSFKRCDFGRGDSLNGCDAGSDRLAFDDHGTRAALSQTAAEFGAPKLQIVAERIEQGSRRIEIYTMRTAIHLQYEFAQNRHLPD